MPINRSNFNLLVDDDGSNLVGTVWDKAHIKDVILDPVDAALVTDIGSWTNIAYVAGDFAALPSGTWTTTAPITYAYSLAGKTMTLAVYGANWTIGGAPVYLTIKIPGGFNVNRSLGGSFPYYQGGIAGTGYYLTEATGQIVKLGRDQLGTPWVAGTNHFQGTFIINIL